MRSWIDRYPFTQVEAALLVAHELIRVAIPWQEIWNEGLEEAWRLYSNDKDVDGMMVSLFALHQLISQVRHALSKPTPYKSHR